MHDLFLDDTTDIASFPEYTDRIATRVVHGVNRTGYFVNDFLQKELERLTLRQRIGGRITSFDGKFRIPSFQVRIRIRIRVRVRVRVGASVRVRVKVEFRVRVRVRVRVSLRVSFLSYHNLTLTLILTVTLTLTLSLTLT
jgi:hypothetical protein